MIKQTPEKLCPCCAKPILLKMAMCRTCWSELPAEMRKNIEDAAELKNYVLKNWNVNRAIDWHRDRKAGVQTEMQQYQPLKKV
jgi:predicted amidophosphoribosyltransferase